MNLCFSAARPPVVDRALFTGVIAPGRQVTQQVTLRPQFAMPWNGGRQAQSAISDRLMSSRERTRESFL
jgi:hypothetical protein